MDRKKLNWIYFGLILLIIVYTLWFVIAHSEPVSFSDLITVWGATLAIFVFIVEMMHSPLKEDIRNTRSDVHKINERLEHLSSDLNYIKGKTNSSE